MLRPLLVRLRDTSRSDHPTNKSSRAGCRWRRRHDSRRGSRRRTRARESFGEGAYEPDERMENPGLTEGKARVPWCTSALLSGKCDGSAISDCIDPDIFVRNKNLEIEIFILKLQISNSQRVFSSGIRTRLRWLRDLHECIHNPNTADNHQSYERSRKSVGQHTLAVLRVRFDFPLSSR